MLNWLKVHCLSLILRSPLSCLCCIHLYGLVFWPYAGNYDVPSCIPTFMRTYWYQYLTQLIALSREDLTNWIWNMERGMVPVLSSSKFSWSKEERLVDTLQNSYMTKNNRKESRNARDFPRPASLPGKTLQHQVVSWYFYSGWKLRASKRTLQVEG